MQSMLEVVSDSSLRPAVVRDVVALIDGEVDRKSGLSGMAIKAGYKVVKALKGGQMIPDVVNGLLDEFCGAIEPLHARYRQAPTPGGFGAFLRSNQREAVDALLSITDRRARTTQHTVLKKTYEKLRPVGEDNVAAALPGVGQLVDRHCG